MSSPRFICTLVLLLPCLQANAHPGACETDEDCGPDSTCNQGRCESTRTCAERDLSAVYFDYDEAVIRGDQEGSLQQVVACLAEWPNERIVIRAHEDERSSAAYNLALTERRANAVRDNLVSRGVAPERLTVLAYGESRPIAEEHTESAWRQNRRVDFAWVSPGWCTEFPYCPLGATCVEDQCSFACGEDETCPDDYHCTDQRCVMCVADEHCAEGWMCRDHLCIQCESNEDCEGCAVCERGECAEPLHGCCETYADCSQYGFTCVDGVCVEGCEVEGEECSGGWTCYEGDCMPADEIVPDDLE